MTSLEGSENITMDLCAIVPNNNKVKEKRERQPNWTEAEKQLLISLTRLHQGILENKGSDTMTIKRKSEAWDDISINMRAAGYQRSKERLKQQLGRIRAAEAKKVKDALTKSLTENNGLAEAGCLLESSAATAPIIRQSLTNMPTPMPELAIKIEKAISLEDFEPSCDDKQTNKDQNDVFSITEQNSPSPIPFMNGLKKQTRQEPEFFSLNPLFIGENEADESGNRLHIFSPHQTAQCKCYNKKKNLRNVRLRINGHSPRTRAQRVRQLHLYRVAVEKERLKMLRLQQKRDKIFYRKDKQIQNLKLQILRNLAVNRINHINFT